MAVTDHAPAPRPGTVQSVGDPSTGLEACCDGCDEVIRLSGMLNGTWLHTGRRPGE